MSIVRIHRRVVSAVLLLTCAFAADGLQLPETGID